MQPTTVVTLIIRHDRLSSQDVVDDIRFLATQAAAGNIGDPDDHEYEVLTVVGHPTYEGQD